MSLSARAPGRSSMACWGLLLVAALTAGCSASATSTPQASASASAKPPSYRAGTVTGGRLPTALADVAFTDQSGKTVHLSDFAGKTVVLQDSMTLCQELCPIDTSTLVAAATAYAQQAKDPGNVVFLTVTVDPRRDTPAQLAAYRKKYVGAAANLPQWELLTGSPADVAALWKHLGVYTERVPQDDTVHNWRTGKLLTYDVDHSDQTFFFDGDLDERYILDGMPALGTNPVPATIQRFMSSEGRRNEARNKGWTAAQALGVLDWLTHASA